jgi:ribosomal protein S1
VKPGDEVTVKVLRVDDDGQKIALGLKQLTADPWARAGDTYAVGQVRTGRVTRIAEFGAFVELEPGIEALAHASSFDAATLDRSQRSNRWSSAVSTGMTAAFEILTVDLDKKRIGVALVPEGSARAREAASSEAAADAGAADTGESFGLLADRLRRALEPREK